MSMCSRECHWFDGMTRIGGGRGRHVLRCHDGGRGGLGVNFGMAVRWQEGLLLAAMVMNGMWYVYV